MNAKLQINKLQLRNDTANNWRIKNPILSKGEMGVEIDTYKIKIGNGITYWNNLPYVGGDVGSDLDTSNFAKLDSYNEFKAYAAFSNGVKISGGLFYDSKPGQKPPRPLSITSEDGIQMKGNVSTESIKITQPATHPLHGVTKAYVDNAVRQINLPIGYITFQPILLDGFLKLDGRIVSSNTYRNLYNWANTQGLMSSSNQGEGIKFEIQGAEGFRIPNYMNKVIMGREIYGNSSIASGNGASVVGLIPQIKY